MFIRYSSCCPSTAIPRIRIALLTIVIPLERLKVREIVSAALCNRLNVIYLPAVLRCRVPIILILHDLTASVMSPRISVIAFDWLSFLSDSENGCASERPAVYVSVSIPCHCVSLCILMTANPASVRRALLTFTVRHAV